MGGSGHRNALPLRRPLAGTASRRPKTTVLLLAIEACLRLTDAW